MANPTNKTNAKTDAKTNAASSAGTGKASTTGSAGSRAANTPAQQGRPAQQPASKQPTAARGKEPGAREAAGTLRITYVKSVIGYSQRQRDTIQSLGLRRLHQTVEHRATPEIRGMVNKVSHLVRVEEVVEEVAE